MNRIGVMTAVAILLAGGCRTAPPQARVPPVEPPPVLLTIGHVLHVNAPRGYVVVQCGSLPSLGEEAKVFRGEQAVARLRISGPSQPPFVTADVLDGEPQAGDTVKVSRRRGVLTPSEAVKP
jgi:hypothetical protein